MRIKEFTMAYAKPDNTLAAKSLILSVAYYVVSIFLTFTFYETWPLFLLFAAMSALGVIRIYMVQHDCGHMSFFAKRSVNDLVGTVLSVVTCTPLKSLRYNHGLHHAHVGNLDQRESSEIYTMTVAEYKAASKWSQFGYRAYRSFFTLFVVGPSIIFLLRYRFPKNMMKTGLVDTMITNALLLTVWGGLVFIFGPKAIMIFVCTSIFAASAGAVIPYCQHNFENTYWERHPELDFETAALKGTTILNFGRVFDLVTANIAYHDLHHLNARIPSYKLKKCHRDMLHMLNPVYVNIGEALSSVKWKLWDEDVGKMIVFPKRREMATSDESHRQMA